jgi:phosphoribosyl-dephospho-CoA transferase
MRVPHRNQLVWLTEAAWLRVLARTWDAQAQAILAHWHTQCLPLVVARKRTPEGTSSISLGLPAPLQWERRKLALEVALADIARIGEFPLLSPGLLGPADAAPLQNFLQQLGVLQVQARVFGSYGWQQISGMPCVRDSSDLDLLIAVPDGDIAGQVVWLLRGLYLSCGVDGELLFADGQAVAWREFAQLIGGRVDQVLVKHRCGVHLVGMADLQALPC